MLARRRKTMGDIYRKRCKDAARAQLKGRRAVPALAWGATMLVSLALAFPNFIRVFNLAASLPFDEALKALAGASQTAAERVADIASLFAQPTLFVASIFVCVKMSRSPAPVHFGDFLEGLSLCLRAVVVSLWKSLLIFAWTLLFIIPGFVKSYAYTFAEFIVAEFPGVGPIRAVDISKRITRGFKASLFILHLTFIGWHILGALTLGVGFFWIVPYYNMTRTNAFHVCLNNALQNGTVLAEELSLSARPDDGAQGEDDAR